MFDLIDSIIATVTVVLLLSLIVQSLQQIVKQVLHMKSRLMERELFALLSNSSYTRTWKPQLLQVMQIAGEKPGVKKLVDSIRNKLSGLGYNDAAALERMDKETFFRLVGDVFDTSELETRDRSAMTADEKAAGIREARFLQQARWDMEQWYDQTVAAFKDHYERRMKMWSYVMGAVVVVWLNANVFDIYREFSTNKTLRESAVRIGERLAAMPKDSLIVTTTADGKDSVRYVPDSLAFKSIQTHIRFIDSTVHAQSFQLFRWKKPADGWSWRNIWRAIIENMFGWLGMTLLVGLGAPFWYDILRSIVGIKERLRGGSGSGQSRERAGAQPSAPAPPQPPPASGEAPVYG